MPNYWLVVGTPKNWQTAFESGNIWGLKETQKRFWERLSENDTLLFYATQPISGIIGYGVVRARFKQDKPLWPKEIQENKVIWPLRFEFDVERCPPQDKWQTSRIVSEALRPRVRGGFQPIETETAQQLMSSIQSISGLEAVEKVLPVTKEEAPKALPSHDILKQKLLEMGKLQKYLAEQEYPLDIGKLDVVWRRVERSVPTYVFEIQVGGDVYHALAKLKHAFDLWNSRIFLIAPQEDRDKVNQLLSGTFHEIRSQLKFIDCKRADQLYALKKNYRNLERELGID